MYSGHNREKCVEEIFTANYQVNQIKTNYMLNAFNSKNMN